TARVGPIPDRHRRRRLCRRRRRCRCRCRCRCRRGNPHRGWEPVASWQPVDGPAGRINDDPEAPMTRRRITALALAGSLPLLLMACTADPDSGPEDPTEAATEEGAAGGPDTVTLGLIPIIDVA